MRMHLPQATLETFQKHSPRHHLLIWPPPPQQQPLTQSSNCQWPLFFVCCAATITDFGPLALCTAENSLDTLLTGLNAGWVTEYFNVRHCHVHTCERWKKPTNSQVRMDANSRLYYRPRTLLHQVSLYRPFYGGPKRPLACNDNFSMATTIFGLPQ